MASSALPASRRARSRPGWPRQSSRNEEPAWSDNPPTRPLRDRQPHPTPPRLTVIYLVAFVTGAIVMSFEMLGSRYLNPYFGSGIYTWAALISTVLAALTVGYFLGGWLADRTASAPSWRTVLVGSLYLLVLPAFAEPLLEFVLADIDDVTRRQPRRLARHPVLSGDIARHVFAVRDPAAAALAREHPARCRARSTASRPPAHRRHARHDLLPDPADRLARDHAARSAAPARLRPRPDRAAAARAPAQRPLLPLAWPLARAVARCRAAARAQDLVDESVRADAAQAPGRPIAHVETEYNDIFITKRRGELTMSFQLKGWDYTESVTNLRDPDDLPLRYAQVDDDRRRSIRQSRRRS